MQIVAIVHAFLVAGSGALYGIHIDRDNQQSSLYMARREVDVGANGD